MGKVIILGGTAIHQEHFMTAISNKMLGTDILGESFTGTTPNILYVTEEMFYNGYAEFEYFENFSPDIFSSLINNETFFSVKMRDRKHLTRKGANHVIETLKDKVDFLFVNVNIFKSDAEEKSETIALDNTNTLNIDSINNVDAIVSLDSDYLGTKIVHNKAKNYVICVETYATDFEESQKEAESIYERNITQNLIQHKSKVRLAYQQEEIHHKILYSEAMTTIDNVIILGKASQDILDKTINIINGKNLKNNELVIFNKKHTNITLKNPTVLRVTSVFVFSLSLFTGLIVYAANTVNTPEFLILPLVISAFSMLISGMILGNDIENNRGLLRTFKQEILDMPKTLHSRPLPKELNSTAERLFIDPSKENENQEITSSRSLANNQAWLKRTKESYQEIYDNWTSYELDIAKSLQYPAMLDFSIPDTLDFYRVKNIADKAMLDSDEILMENRVEVEKLVADLEISFLKAEQYAVKNKIGQYTLEDQKKLRDALPIAELALSKTATDEERETATKALLKKIDGVVVLPKKSQEILQKNLLSQ